jgi:DNA transposition AAA+ family ATPase
MVRQVPAAECDALRAEIREFMRSRPDLTAEHFAQYTTSPASTIRLFMGGQINGGHHVVGEVREALRQAKAGDILMPGEGTSAIALTESPTSKRRVGKRGNFYRTQTVTRVAQVLDYCAEHCAIGVVTADYGVGKTEAVKEWRTHSAGKVDSVVIEFDAFSSTNKVDFIRLLARHFGVAHEVGSQNGGPVFRAVCDYLRANPCLMIFDQCEQVRSRVFEIIRQIWDHTREAGVGVVMLAAPILLKRMMRGSIEELGAITSRVGMWAPLTGLTRHEMTDILRQEGVTNIDDAAFDLWLRATGGSMRRLMRSLDLIKAKHGDRRITEKTIAGVAGNLFGMHVGGGE